MSAISNVEFKRPIWHTVLTLTLGFWLSASLFLDWIIMPSMYLSGMMNLDNFASAGYSIFWSFNRIELLSAGIVLTSILVLSKTQLRWYGGVAALAITLLSISFAFTYFLTPEMCATGIHLNLFESTSAVPANMNLLHGLYWSFELFKLTAIGLIFGWCWRQKA
ncbi:MAG: hypothetical protein IGS39_18725 [Calothrix sp. C42_A2020_038]|nr:hypothetical protein [Calothrix sp. C42_A2020_038]